MTKGEFHDFIASPEEIIEDARNGRMFILVDAEDRENEGDVIIPAQMATPDAINFMAKHARGLVCLAVTEERAERLKLPMMSRDNGTVHQTAFTVSIEAKEGVTTGISAHDRARTIAVAIDPSKGPTDIVTPGHVFPLVARRGGVLVRAGHTEAAVDISRLAGLIPSGVICEVMNDDGTMARLPDLVKFAQLHGMKVGTIADLIAYRRRNDHFITRSVETEIDSHHGGKFKMMLYVNTVEYAEHIALVKGDVATGGPVLVRMHAVNLFDDLLAVRGGRDDVLTRSMEAVDKAGRGVVVLIRESRSTYISDLLLRKQPQPETMPRRLKEYGVGAQILLDLGVRDMVLLTNSASKQIVGLEGYGLRVVGTQMVGSRYGS
ncbi:MAG: 3,4-dihydroxy-2-butanone-4-phosphate synthase [Alphaproteobacteria bacterium]|nr:3,4-dihydroxy-2-butanone-4-phosphate synthase [Alphaproteobacteria bacterium]